MPIRIHRAHPSNGGGTTMATITITAADAATDTAALHATATAPAATPADVAAAKRFVSDFVDRSLPEYQKISLAIHDKPEVSNYEFFASTTLADQLKSEGFDVTVGVASHRTGFEAAYDTGRPAPSTTIGWIPGRTRWPRPRPLVRCARRAAPARWRTRAGSWAPPARRCRRRSSRS